MLYVDFADLADAVECVVVGLRLSGGLASGVQHADWHLPGVSLVRCPNCGCC